MIVRAPGIWDLSENKYIEELGGIFMIKAMYGRAFEVLKKKPLRLWGISLLSVVLAYLAGIGFAGILAIGLAVEWLLDAAMANIFLKGLHGEEPESADLFATFKKDCIARTAGGMGWRALWVFLWGLIPICGFVFGTIKKYAYAFTPYILLQRPEVSATQAIKVSEKETEGYRGKMFLADFLAILLFAVALLILNLLGLIPVLGVLFKIVYFALLIAGLALMPLFLGLVHAAFYEEIQRCNADPAYRAKYFAPAPAAPAAPMAAPVQPEGPVSFCPNCGTKIPEGTAFCPNCGTKQN